MSDLIYQLWLYNDWANSLLISRMKTDTVSVPSSCLRLLSHIFNAQLTWLSRMNNEPSTMGVWDVHDLTTCEQLHISSSESLRLLVMSDQLDLLEKVCYTNTKNESFENSVRDILLHLFNHGTYHRAQIAMEMRKNGLSPVNTDYITFVRMKC